MVTLTILGSSNALPDETHNNTHMALHTHDGLILIDCVGNQLLLLRRAGLNYQELTDIILTHFHPDHVSGVPSLLLNLWLLGRKHRLNIYGLTETIEKVSAMMDLFGWDAWPNFFPVAFHTIGDDEMTRVLENDAVRIYASPVCHLIPTLGLRIETINGGNTLAYSCDTEPCPAVIHLAHGADYLIHESTGALPGHSSAYQAGEVAHQCGAKALYLIHYPTENINPVAMTEEAQRSFDGQVLLAEDYMKIELEIEQIGDDKS